MTKLFEFYKKHQFIPTTFDILSDENFRRHQLNRENLYVNKLMIPSIVWRNAKVLEVGCGSGENSLIHAKNGARLTFIEPLEYSINHLKALFRHYGVEGAIENIYIDTVENITLDKQYDIIVAEGFISTLQSRRQVLRKLYQSLANDGLLIFSTMDITGGFCEFAKAAIAQFYCRKKNIEDLDRQAETIKLFFKKDYTQIPHLRTFELWAKDILLNPVMTSNLFYDFDEIVKDLTSLKPKFYSSWPSYKHSNDLRWYKDAWDKTKDKDLEYAIQGYYLRRPSFMFGEIKEESEAMSFLLKNQDNFKPVTPHLKNIIYAIEKELHKGETGISLSIIQEAMEACHGKVRRLLKEMLDNLLDLSPEVYRKSTTIRQHWGVPCHWIVFRK